MAKFFSAVLFSLLACTTALAHEMEPGTAKEWFGLKAEYLHVLLNPLPVYGLAIGVFVLAVGVGLKSQPTRNVGLLIVLLCAASAWPVLYFGQQGYNHLFAQLDPNSQQWLKLHMHRAEIYIYSFYATALLAIAALVTQKRFQKLAKALSLLTALAAFISVILGAWISRAGGQISHPEFRRQELPLTPPAHQDHS